MSRREFRVAVKEPRPASAWVMVSVASATLWITQQLEVWAWSAQVMAIGVSLWRRHRPFWWQSNPWMLNVFMMGIAGGTILVALRGQPSTVALAHFAAATQGLQLIDSRPRRTEYLLVTLALFQVVLAANLTDSVFFTPLLLAFVLSTVWTLIVHTLRSEALEAGCVRELSGAFTPGLMRTCLVASTLSVVLALLLFVTLPRLRSSVVRGPSGAFALAAAGFSDRVEFGELGRIRQDPTVVLRVETLEGDPPPRSSAYFRGLAFDHFDGQAWSITPSDRIPVAGSAEGGVGLGPEPRHYDLVQRIVREPVAAGVLFRIGEPTGLQGTIRRLERDSTGGLYGAGQANERVRYVVRSRRAQPADLELARDRAVAPRKRDLSSVPPFSAAVSELTARIVAGAQNDAERARAIERHLLTNGRYTDTPPEADPSQATPVERFLLGEMAGHCEYFASAMVVLARQAGLPARLMNGFAGGRTNAIGGFVELTRSDAHAWVEIHYEQAGWVRYDPTPPDLRSRADGPLSIAARARDLASALELWWFQRVVGFDRADQMGALKRAWLAWKDRGGDASRGAPSSAPSKRGLAAWRDVLERREAVVGGALVLAAGGGLVFLAARRRRRPASPHAAYDRAVRLLARRGIVREASAAPRTFARQVGRELPGLEEAFGRLTEAYLCERYAERQADGAGALERFESALRETSARG